MVGNDTPDLDRVTQFSNATRDLSSILEGVYPNLRLPAKHQQILREYAWLSGYHGYLRLLGYSSGNQRDLISWNEADCWKFSWAGDADNYLCFGDTALGDQYAYLLDSSGRLATHTVFLLDFGSMEAEEIASSFDEFLDFEFIRHCKEPFYSSLIRAFSFCGDIDFSELLVQVPHHLLECSDEEPRLMRMDARSAMISNGDIATAVSQLGEDDHIEAADTYVDDLGRSGMRLATSQHP